MQILGLKVVMMHSFTYTSIEFILHQMVLDKKSPVGIIPSPFLLIMHVYKKRSRSNNHTLNLHFDLLW